MLELLRALGERVGILSDYVNYDGTQRIVTGEDTYRAILQSMGFSLDEVSLSHALQSFENGNQHTRHGLEAQQCVTVEERSGKRKVRGLWTNIYSIRSRRNWGVGDFGDLRRLVKLAGDFGLDFVALNPLHALRNSGPDVSPYRPVSRIYRNEIYLEIRAIPELSQCPDAMSLIASMGFEGRLQRARQSAAVEYDRVADMKRVVLWALHRRFQLEREDGDSTRWHDYCDYVEREGDALQQFATFKAIDEQLRDQHGKWLAWHEWHGELLDSRSPQVQEFQRQYRDDVDFHCYVQFELDRQLSVIAQFAKDVGLGIGLMGDLAIGAAPDGSDAWTYPELFLKGVSVGAPPDDLGPEGQNWGLPPANPLSLGNDDYAFFRLLLRNNLAHMGALRIDHVMGLLRQFWIPEGFDGSKGAYVQFPAEELFTIVAEESRRSGAVIVGEDLGTVPDGFRELLHRFGVLSTCVVHFEREWGGNYKPAGSYPDQAYVVVATHDMVPLAGFAEGRDLQLRKQVGLVSDGEAWQQALQRRREDWERLKTRLEHEGFAIGQREDEIASACRALIQFLYRSPCCMAGVSLDDLAGEREPVNVPGVGQDRHASWSRRMTMSLEEIAASQAIAEMVRPEAA